MTISKILNLIGEVLLQMIYPDCCPFCGDLRVDEDGVCKRCRQKLVEPTEPLCKRCGKPILHGDQEYCHDCQERKEKRFEMGRSLWIHQTPVSDAIYRLKYNDCRCYARFFAWEMWKRFEWQICRWEIDVLIPVPIHIQRRRKRGYNQAELLAKALSDFSGIPVDPDVVIRVKNTDAQKGVLGREREHNLCGAFSQGESAQNYRNALIVDDIFTTGSTISAVAEQLLIKGVKKVYFITISIGQGF